MTRYSGVAVVVATAIFLFVFHWQRGDGLSFATLRAVVHFVVAILPLVLWTMRNVALTGTPLGVRPPTVDTFDANLERMIDTFANWFFPLNYLFYGTRTTLTILFILSLIFFRHLFIGLKELVNSYSMIYTILLSLLYSVFIFITSITTAIDPLGWRLLSPVSIPLLIIIFKFGQAIFNSARKKSNCLAYILPAFALTWIASNSLLVVDAIYQVRKNGLDYSSAEWQSDSIVSFLRNTNALENCDYTYSNNPVAVFLFANHSAYFTPLRTYYRSPQLADTLDDKWLHSQESCVVWFVKTFDILYTLEELKTTADFTPLIELESGGVYKVRKRATP